MEMTLDGGHRNDPVMSIVQMPAGFFRRYRPHLRHDDTGDDLKTIADSVLNFTKQNVLLPKQFVLLAFQEPLAGDVLDTEQNIGARSLLVENLAGIQKHRPAPDVRKVVLDLAILHRATFGKDPSEQRSQPRRIPFAIAQFVEQLALRVPGIDRKGTIKRSARSNNAQILVEHHEGFAHGID